MLVGNRLLKARERLGLSRPDIGELFGYPPKCSSNIYKLEVGLVPITGLRLEVLEALEEALKRASPHEVWGAHLLPTRQRLTRIFALAYPEEIRRVAS